MFLGFKQKRRKRAKKHGFLSRMKSPGGSSLLARRRRKGREKIAVA